MRYYTIYDFWEVLSHDIQNMRNQDLIYFTNMFMHRLKKADEQRAWDLYCVAYAQMDKNNYKTFQQFYNPTKKVEAKKSTEDVIKHVEQLRKAHQGKGEKHGII